MSTDEMSTESLGNKLRKLREETKLPLRKVAAIIDLDVAILSKMERGERRLTREVVLKLGQIYKQDPNELMVLYLSEKVLNEIGREELALQAMQVAEAQIKYRLFMKTDRNQLLMKLTEILKKFSGIQQAWIFGSFARKDDGPKSDIDVAVKTDPDFSYFDLADVQEQAGKALKRKVDIGFMDAFKPNILEHIQPDLQLIYEKE
jgi:predicted nucleotidyltransferase/plasmid maintenance system antidote protein VapI